MFLCHVLTALQAFVKFAGYCTQANQSVDMQHSPAAENDADAKLRTVLQDQLREDETCKQIGLHHGRNMRRVLNEAAHKAAQDTSSRSL